MRTHFDELLSKSAPGERATMTEPYMPYWYGGLYAVIEGWRELGLTDDRIDPLLKSPNVDLLRRYRNGAFHFQRCYYDKRFREFITEGENCVEWIRTLNSEFGRWFLTWYKERKAKERKKDPS